MMEAPADGKSIGVDQEFEGGATTPPSGLDQPATKEHIPKVESDPVEQAVEVLAEVLPAGDLERARRIVRTALAWSGPLPPPSELREYGEVAPNAIEVIIADFQRRSEMDTETARHLMSVTDRELTLLEREQELRNRESAADISTRAWVQKAGAIFTVLVLIGAFVTLLLAPVRSDWARVALAGLWFLPIVVFGAAVVLRGRYSDNEREVMMQTLPRIIEASERNQRTSQSGRSNGDEQSERAP